MKAPVILCSRPISPRTHQWRTRVAIRYQSWMSGTRKSYSKSRSGLFPMGLAWPPTGALRLFPIGQKARSRLSILEARKEVGRISVGHLPYTIAVSPAKDVAYTAAFGDDKVVVLDLRTHSVPREIPVGKSPWGLAVDSSGSHVAVANFYSGSISVIKVGDPRAADGFSVETYELRGAKPGDHITSSPTARKPTDGMQTAMIGGVERAKHVEHRRQRHCSVHRF